MAIVPPLPWVGGVDRSRTSVESDANTAYSLKNVRTTAQGVKRVRGGLRSYFRGTDGTYIGANGATGTTAINGYNGVRRVFPYQYGEDYKLLTVMQDGMHYNTLGGHRRVDNSLVIAQPIDMMQFGASVLITALSNNAVNARKSAKLFRWDGASSVVPVESAPTARYLRSHYNRVIAAGNYQEPTLWYASAPGNPDAWNTDYAEDPDASGFLAEIPGNRSITGISPSHYGGFYISTEESLHFINGRAPSEFSASTVLISNGLGNFGHRTFMNVRGSIVGWNHSGCYMLTDTDRSGGVAPGEISGPIAEVFRRYVRRVPDLFFSVDDYANGQYMTFMPHIENASATIVIVWNYRYNHWYWYEIMDNIYSACMWGRGHDDLLLMGNSTCLLTYFQNGQLLDYAGTDWASEFNVRITTHRMVIGNQDYEADVRAIGMMVRDTCSKPITVTYWLDQDNYNDIYRTLTLLPNPARRPVLGSTYVLGSSRLSSHDDVVIIKSHRGGRGRYGRLEINMDASDLGDLQIHGLFFETDDLGGGAVR